ncbi:hypothetical protein LV779_15645 [Streptomyces thinghirensis]|nr:hypothetical protein [Streptomyces thinghirensis]
MKTWRLNLAARYADRLIALASGQLHAAGTTEDMMTEATGPGPVREWSRGIEDRSPASALILPMACHHTTDDAETLRLPRRTPPCTGTEAQHRRRTPPAIAPGSPERWPTLARGAAARPRALALLPRLPPAVDAGPGHLPRQRDGADHLPLQIKDPDRLPARGSA